jgi:hypothetical protein
MFNFFLINGIININIGIYMVKRRSCTKAQLAVGHFTKDGIVLKGGPVAKDKAKVGDKKKPRKSKSKSKSKKGKGGKK